MPDPVDPLTGLMEAAASQHELYLCWLQAGFTPEQALELLKVFIAGIMPKAVG